MGYGVWRGTGGGGGAADDDTHDLINEWNGEWRHMTNRAWPQPH